MAETLTVGTPPIAVALRRSARARRMTLRVSAVDGGAVLTVPKRVGARLISEFLEERSDWLRAAQARTPQPVAVAPGAVLPIEGVARQVRATSGRQVVLTDGAVQVPGAAGAVGPRLLGWIKQVARDRVVTAADHHAARLGRRPGRITLRDTRSRWGSCTSEGHIMLSWRLLLAPPQVLDYVVAHEVAHLQEMNHSPAFWSVVRDLCPDYERHRRWLHQHGADLHRYRFKV